MSHESLARVTILARCTMYDVRYTDLMKYDPFQLKAIVAIDKEESLIVSAPTGAGKTCPWRAARERS